MRRSILVTLVVIVCLGALHCKPRTAGLEQSTGAADEASAISNLKTIAQAETAYSVSNAGDYETLEQLVAGGYLDTRFGGSKPKLRCYVFTVNATSRSSGAGESSYSCNADPDVTAINAGRHFYLDSSSPQIHVHATRPATANEEALQP